MVAGFCWIAGGGVLCCRVDRSGDPGSISGICRPHSTGCHIMKMWFSSADILFYVSSPRSPLHVDTDFPVVGQKSDWRLLPFDGTLWKGGGPWEYKYFAEYGIGLGGIKCSRIMGR